MGGKKTYVEEYQEEVDHDVDLSVYLQGKYLPVVYGVMRVPGIPIFADTLKNDPNSIYVAYGLSEGEIQGIYNLYIDSNSLLCVDAQDATARTGSDATALTCYGRMDRGGTLSGTNINSSGTLSFEDWLDVEGLTDEYDNAYTDSAEESYENMYDDYVAINESNIPQASVTDDLEGLGHEESASISSPHDMNFTFYAGRPFQKTSNILATLAAGDSFKRQDSYYTGLERYWSPDHTLLDTAYAVAKFKIDADSTTVPEVEYVVKGKALQCFNYDGTFISDPVYQAATQSAYGGEADNPVNFKEGDIISVETSYNGTVWQAETGFRILHKYIDGEQRLGGIGDYIAQQLMKKTDVECRVTSLGHVQRGAPPTASDRILASAFGVYAVDLLNQKKFDRMVAWKDRKVVDVPIDEGISTYKNVERKDSLVETALSLGIYLGDNV